MEAILNWLEIGIWCERNIEDAMMKSMLSYGGKNGVEIEWQNWEVDCAIQFLLWDGKKYRVTKKIKMGHKVKNPCFPMADSWTYDAWTKSRTW